MNVNWNDETDGGSDRIPERYEIAEKDTWDVAVLYADDATWDADFDRIDSLTAPIEAMRGQLNSAEALASLFKSEDDLERLIDRLHTYAHLRADEDTANQDNQARQSRIRAKSTEVGGRLAWVRPEILSHSEETLREWVDAPELADRRQSMVRLLRRKPHTLSDKEETLLSNASEVFSTPSQAYSMLTNADMRFPDIVDGEGKTRELSQGRYISFLLDRDRDVRRRAFESMYDTYGSYRNTLSCTLSSNVKLRNFMARTRNFPSALAASLHGDDVPVSVYEAMIGATHDAFPHFNEYIALRQRMLGLDKVDMYDMYVPIVPDYEIKVSFDQAREWVIEACRPLGEEYVAALTASFDERWADVYENRGKRSGAYSSGCYDSLPYMLLNYQDTLDDVFTLAHELGHSMHSHLANGAQPYHYSHYPIFTAEIPSTLNEALLLRYLLDRADDPRMKAYLLNHLCDSFKGTVYRQTMFAEFEKIIHEMDADGAPLTSEALNERYYALNAEYYGPDVEGDQRIGCEWSRIPHFYYNFYVYKYATSFCATQIFVQRVLEGGEKRDQYLNMLRSGGSDDPLVLIGNAGVDLTDRGTLESAFGAFGESVAELGRTLDELEG